MSVKANWHVDDLLADADQDPFDEVRVEDIGKPIDLDGDEPALVERLAGLIEHERELRHQGVRCPIRDRSDSSCTACPVARPGKGRFGQLCSVGIELEQLCTTIAVMQEAPGVLGAT